MVQKTIVIIGTLDTKGTEIEYLKDLISRRGHNPLVIDVGIFDSNIPLAGVSRGEVAAAAGKTIADIQNCGNEGEAISLMAAGALIIVQQLLRQGRMDGLVCIGGSMGTSIGLTVMRNLPLSVPKLMLSSVAFTALVTPGVVSIDQVMMQTVGDLCGLNPITKLALRRAAGAICGMVEEQGEEKKEKPVIGITALGVHSYTDYCIPLLLEKGFEPVVFHAVGTNACEKLIKDGYIDGMLDLSIFELVNSVCGGVFKGCDEKIKAACEKGMPQIIAPGGLQFFSMPGPELPQRLKNRYVHFHNPLVLTVQSSEKEKEEIAKILVQKVNDTKGPTVILIPLRGFSSLDKEGMPFHNPDTGHKFAGILKKGITNSMVEIIELDVHINDRVFSKKAVELLIGMMKRQGCNCHFNNFP